MIVFRRERALNLNPLATAYVFKDTFDEYAYHPENPSEPTLSHDSESSQTDHVENAAVEIPLNTLIDCLNIFGTASAPSSLNASKYKTWRRADDGSDHDRDDNRARDRNRQRGNEGANGRIDQYFSGPEKRTGMRMSYAGMGHPLTLLL